MDTKKITTNESCNDAKREKVRVIPIQFFDDFPKHPFNVKMDAEMEALIESTAYYKNEYCFNHYTVYLREMELSLANPLMETLLPLCLPMEYREDIAEQIESWELPEAVKRTAINDPNLYYRVQSALSDKEYYKVEYSEAISEVAHKLTAEHAKIEDLLDKVRKDGKL